MHPTLTVRENLAYSARLRLPWMVRHQERDGIVRGVMSMLGLMHIQNSIVGTIEKRGISGRRTVAPPCAHLGWLPGGDGKGAWA